MGLLGNLALYGAVLSVLATIGCGLQAARTGAPAWMRRTEGATLALAGFVVAAVLALQIALVTLDFSLKYVGEYTSSTLSVPYRIGSMWAGQGGSLLLWALIISISGAITVRAQRRKGLDLSPWSYVVSAVFAGLFLGMNTFLQNPFVPQDTALADGVGLNPLLQNPLQLIHPLFLYCGYVLFTVPFAIVMGSLIGGKVRGPWIEHARVWSLISWVSLTIGMVLGARWAYAELGWGGYWAWDPVENASLIPWLSGTALLHTGLTHRGDRSRLRMSSVILLVATFNLCLFGTFLTRSGVIQSVHAFGISNLGPLLGAAIVASVLGCGGVLVWRLPDLKLVDERRHSWGWFGQLVLVVLLVAMTIAVLWGTLYPLFARAFLGQEVAVSPGFFKAVVSPMGIGLLVLFAISPFLPDQRIANVQREAALRVVLFVVIAGASLLLGAAPVTALVLALSVLSVKTILWKAQPKIGAALQERRGRVLALSRAGSPYLAHMGLIILLAAITVNVTGEVKEQVKLDVGKSATVAGQVIRLDSARIVNYPDRQALEATVSLLDANDAAIGSLQVSVRAFSNSDQPHTQVGIRSGIARDIYIVIDSWPEDISNGVAWLRLSVYDNPAVNWVWFGGGLLGLAGILYAMPVRRRRIATITTSDDVDVELSQIIDAAIETVRAGSIDMGNERVAALVRTARDLSGGDDATPDDIVTFLERTRSANVASPGGGVSLSRNSILGLAFGMILLVGIGSYVLGHTNGSAAPGISDSPTNTASASASPVDETEVAALMQKITDNPKDVDSFSQLGAIYYTAGSDLARAGEQSAAVQYFTKAYTYFKTRTELAPQDVNAWLDAGASALASNQMEPAFAALQKAVSLDPRNQMAHFDLGIYYLNTDPAQPKKADQAFQTVVDIDPTTSLGKTAALRVGVGEDPTPKK